MWPQSSPGMLKVLLLWSRKSSASVSQASWNPAAWTGLSFLCSPQPRGPEPAKWGPSLTAPPPLPEPHTPGSEPSSSTRWVGLGLAPRRTLFASNSLTSQANFQSPWVPGSPRARLEWTQLHSSFQNPASQPPVCFNPRWKSAPKNILILNCNPP